MPSRISKSKVTLFETNFRYPLGEIDIITREKNKIVFIEVKTRRSNRLKYPEQVVALKTVKAVTACFIVYAEKN